MGKVILPRLNQTGANEWSDVQSNDEALATVVNGEISNENIAAGAAIARSKLEPGAQGIQGTTYPVVSIATEQSTASTSFTTLATPDEVTGVVVPAGAIVRVGYVALWKNSTSLGKVFATLTANSVSLTTAATATTEAQITTSTEWHVLSTGGVGTAALVTGREITALPSLAGFSGLETYLSAGTYSFAVKFRAEAGSGPVVAKERKLWVSVTTF